MCFLHANCIVRAATSSQSCSCSFVTSRIIISRSLRSRLIEVHFLNHRWIVTAAFTFVRIKWSRSRSFRASSDFETALCILVTLDSECSLSIKSLSVALSCKELLLLEKENPSSSSTSSSSNTEETIFTSSELARERFLDSSSLGERGKDVEIVCSSLNPCDKLSTIFSVVIFCATSLLGSWDSRTKRSTWDCLCSSLEDKLSLLCCSCSRMTSWLLELSMVHFSISLTRGESYHKSTLIHTLFTKRIT